MSKDYHEQTDHFQFELKNLIDRFTIGDADGPDKEVMDSPLEPRLNFQTIIGCLYAEATELSMMNTGQLILESIDDDSVEDEDNLELL